MKGLIFCVIVLFLGKAPYAQTIKSFSCITRIDSASNCVVYSVKVRFNTGLDKEERWKLVKLELEKNHHVISNDIIAVEQFLDKRYRTYRYGVKAIKPDSY